MKILITGGAGFIGSWVAEMYLKNNHQVVVVDDLSSGKKENIPLGAKFYQVDIQDKKKLRGVFKKEKPEIINHHAAQKSIRFSVEDPIFDAQINILGGLNLLELAREFKIKKFIFASTGGAIYGDTNNLPTPETEIEKPISPYGVAKLSLEKYLYFYQREYNLPYVILRYSNVYGPRQDPKGEAGVVAIFCQNFREKKPSTVFGDGRQTRDFVFVEDVAQASLLALKYPKSESQKSDFFNIGTSQETDVLTLYHLLKTIFQSRFKPIMAAERPGEQRKSCLAIDKAIRELRWRPKTDLKKGLEKTAQWFKSAKSF